MGPPAANVTIAHLLKHQSGLADFDVNDAYEARVLADEAHSLHSPLEDLQVVVRVLS
jgi:CubicO group peptidase (beta-lactamase class C family)